MPQGMIMTSKMGDEYVCSIALAIFLELLIRQAAYY